MSYRLGDLTEKELDILRQALRDFLATSNAQLENRTFVTPPEREIMHLAVGLFTEATETVNQLIYDKWMQEGGNDG